jgi:hypothetical protein
MSLIKRSIISSRLIGMGDSHLDNFSFFCAATCRIPGATAYGLLSDQSETRAREAFLGFLSAFPDHIPLLCLGEVDCNSLPWRKSTTNKPSYYIHQSVNRLLYFIKETNRKFILPSVTLPPVDDYSESGNRLHVTSSRSERTELVRLYNKLLKTNASKAGHYYLDITSPTTGLDGFVSESFIRSSNDSHLMPSKVLNLARDLLNQVPL